MQVWIEVDPVTAQLGILAILVGLGALVFWRTAARRPAPLQMQEGEKG